MILTICNYQFDTDDIKSIDIRESKVFVETKEDFFNLRWTDPEEIQEAQEYLKFEKLTEKELQQAVMTIILVCDYFLNRKEQCAPCPLKKQQGCIFSYLPIDWR